MCGVCGVWGEMPSSYSPSFHILLQTRRTRAQWPVRGIYHRFPRVLASGLVPFFFPRKFSDFTSWHLHLHIHPDAADRNGYAAHFIQGDTPLCRKAASAFVSHCWPTRGSDSSLTTGTLSSRQPETSLPQKWQGKETPGVFVPNLPSEKRDGGLSVV